MTCDSQMLHDSSNSNHFPKTTGADHMALLADINKPGGIIFVYSKGYEQCREKEQSRMCFGRIKSGQAYFVL